MRSCKGCHTNGAQHNMAQQATTGTLDVVWSQRVAGATWCILYIWHGGTQAVSIFKVQRSLPTSLPTRALSRAYLHTVVPTLYCPRVCRCVALIWGPTSERDVEAGVCFFCYGFLRKYSSHSPPRVIMAPTDSGGGGSPRSWHNKKGPGEGPGPPPSLSLSWPLSIFAAPPWAPPAPGGGRYCGHGSSAIHGNRGRLHRAAQTLR